MIVASSESKGTSGAAVQVRPKVRLTRATVEKWPGMLVGAGAKVIAPVAVGASDQSRQVEYRLLSKENAAATGLFTGLPRTSPKGAWFPRSEPVLRIKRNGKTWAVEDEKVNSPATVVFGARPCDAAAPDILAPLFGWDYHDAFFEGRLKR